MANPIQHKRYTVESNVDNHIIVDNNGVDDYFHLGNDIDDIQAVCELLNKYYELLQFLFEFNKTHMDVMCINDLEMQLKEKGVDLLLFL